MDVTITTYHTHTITLNPDNGQFRTVIDDDAITAETLADLKGRLDKIDASALDAARKAQRPVNALVVSGTRDFQAVTILGIHAGRTSSKALRVLVNGQKASLELSHYAPLTVLHPLDPRAVTIQAHIQAITDAQAALAAAETTFKTYRATLPSVQVPPVADKEVALREEPAFLASIQAAIDHALRVEQAHLA